MNVTVEDCMIFQLTKVNYHARTKDGVHGVLLYHKQVPILAN